MLQRALDPNTALGKLCATHKNKYMDKARAAVSIDARTNAVKKITALLSQLPPQTSATAASVAVAVVTPKSKHLHIIWSEDGDTPKVPQPTMTLLSDKWNKEGDPYRLLGHILIAYDGPFCAPPTNNKGLRGFIS